jgi:EKC/KEOPS complex subunit PCC1/LAGE3
MASLITIPLPTARLASCAMRALAVDKELSLQVRRTLSVAPLPSTTSEDGQTGSSNQPAELRALYQAATNRLLRVAVNGFLESLGVVLGVMEELDVDVLREHSASVQ